FVTPNGGTIPLSLVFQTQINPGGGSFVAASDQQNPSAQALLQTFVVPVGTASLTLSYDFFDSTSSPVVLGSGLSTASSNQQARVDVLTAAAGAFDVGPAVVANLFQG